MTRLRLSLVLLTLVTLISMPLPAAADPPGAFDYYLLEQSWLPEFCDGTVARKPTQMPHPECGDIETRFGATHPTVHGLWPQNDGSDYPASCNGSPGCATSAVCPLNTQHLDEALRNELDAKWMPGYPNLADHEWKKHGTCSGLDQNDYFAAVVSVAAKVPAQQIPADKLGQDVDLSELRTWWGEPRAAFLCDRRQGKQFLAGVRTCWERDDAMKPGDRFECPSNIGDTCSANKKVRLTQAKNLVDVGTSPGGSGGKGCNKPGQGPACKGDQTCKDDGWLRCAKSNCCTNVKK